MAEDSTEDPYDARERKISYIGNDNYEVEVTSALSSKLPNPHQQNFVPIKVMPLQPELLLATSSSLELPTYQ
ncbi:hypothetical protein Ahy_B03g062699 isoform B [Arachis hypogaea]|uniref:Uncharacterized protein n=1 Tax=Arachis hypogaea TaxID=3818 RepID=A0A444ZVK3_ARAHY|nr:hypothetical protein Ahy_B03g062699 isoform B [Arachis hypogaea]